MKSRFYFMEGFMVIVFLLLLAAAAMTMAEPAPNFYGVARAPHSDALTSWLHGTLGFYFEGTSANTLLLRPSISLTYASILTIAGDIGVIPLVFIAVLALGLTAAYALADRAGRLALMAGAALFWLAPQITLASTAPDSLNTDFPALACTLAGLLLALAPGDGRRGGAAGEAARVAGWLLIGFAAAVRGPLLAAGPALLCLTALWLRAGLGAWRPALLRVGLAAAAFLIPVVGDSALRAAIGVVGSQGLMAFYCFYADPTHTLTNETYFRYMELQPPAGEVLRDYLAFVFSEAGRGVVRDMTLMRLNADAAYAGRLYVFLAVPAAFILGLGLRALRRLEAGRGDGLNLGDGVDLAAGGAIAVLIGVSLGGDLGGSGAGAGAAFAAALVVVAAWGAARGRYAPAGLAVAFLAGTLFLTLTGTAGYERVSFTYFMCAPLALIWAAASAGAGGNQAGQGGAPCVWTPVQTGGAAAAAGVVVLGALLATFANSLWPTAMKATWRNDVAGQSAAIKIADAPALDRSLYYSGRGEILYVRRDERPVGGVARYRRFDNPNGEIGDPNQLEGLRGFNALFHKPGAFVE